MNPFAAVSNNPACSGRSSRRISTVFRLKAVASLISSGSSSAAKEVPEALSASAAEFITMLLMEHPEVNKLRNRRVTKICMPKNFIIQWINIKIVGNNQRKRCHGTKINLLVCLSINQYLSPLFCVTIGEIITIEPE